MLIEVQNVRKCYGEFEAVKGASFEVDSGCVALLGPNGAGKTTIISMICGLCNITSGKINLFSQSVAKYGRELRARIGVVPQFNSLDPDLTVSENLIIYGTYFGLDIRYLKDRARLILKQFHMLDKAELKIYELSGGLQRRLVVARSLINNPGILILDEPTTGLDPQSRIHIWEIVEELKYNNVAVLLTTHYMEEAARLSDYVYFIDNGIIIAHGKVDKLVEKYVGTFVVEVEDEEAVQLCDSLKITYEKLMNRYIIYLNKDREQLISRLKGLRNFKYRTANLEDVFLKITGKELIC